MKTLTRRQLGAIAGGGLFAAADLTNAPAQTGTITAGEVVDRIQKNIGFPWDFSSRRDTFKQGGPGAVVRGIASSFGGDLRVCQRALALGLNMLIVHEPTFYSDQDIIPWVKSDPVYEAKRAWMNKNNFVVWRTHDNWHARNPDGIQTGWDNGTGWAKYRVPGPLRGAPRMYKLPPTTLGGVANELATTLKTHSIRVIGDLNQPVSVVGRGGHQLVDNIIASTACDCIIVSEAREFDSHEYLRDSVISGERKGVVIISHVTGEDMGMLEMERWLTPLVPEVPIRFVSTDDAFWTV
jgi:putative NIF3 family GTP cyclohydrolase 1 type 2